jgi:hypothetical protein
MTSAPPTTDVDHGPAMRRNLRLLPWWWVLRWAWFGEAIWVIYLIQERGLTIGQVFLFEAAFSAVVIASEVPTGAFADRYGRRISLLAGTALTIAGFFAFGTGTGLALLLTAYVLLGLGEAFMSGADSAMLFDTLRSTGRGEQFTRRMGGLNARVTAAIAAFTLLGAGSVELFPLWFPIIVSGVASLPALVFAWLLVEPPREPSSGGFAQTGRAALLAVTRSRPLWAAVLLQAFGMVAIAVMSVTLQPVVVGYGVPLWSLGVFAGAQMLLSAAGSLMAAPARRLLGLRTLFWLMPVGGALALLAGASGVIWLFPLFILPSITFNVLYVHVTDFIARRVTDHQRATAISVASFASSFANIGAAVALGVVADAASLRLALVVAALALAALSLAAFAAWAGGGDLDAEPAEAPAAT